jgi:recombinational DNA repair protein (RecF pathway)
LACEEPLTPVINYLSLHEGGVFCPRCGQNQGDVEAIEPDVLKVLRYLQSQPWLDVQKLTIRPHIMRQVENTLYRYVLTVLERHLKSADFIRKLQAMFNQPTL